MRVIAAAAIAATFLRRLSPAALLLALLAQASALATPAATGRFPASQLCRAAIAQVEREAPPGLPARLLSAIGRVESGRRDAETGEFGPWPWTINAEGRGSFFPDKAAAVAAVRALLAQGVRSIDIGCMQVNLRHHPQAFASLEEAFDPLANARYALRFLTELHAGPAGGDWMRAASFYHSQTPHLAEAYRGRLVAALATERGQPAPPSFGMAAAGFPPGSGAMSLSNRAEAAPMRPMMGAGQGRGLDAYRAAPIPLTGRVTVAARSLLPATPRVALPLSPAPAPAAASGPSAGPGPGPANGPAATPPARPLAGPLMPHAATQGRGPLIPGLPSRS